MNSIQQFKERYLFFAILSLAAVIALPMGISNAFSVVCLVAFVIHDRFNNFINGIKNDILPKIICVYFILIVLSSLREPTFNQSVDIVLKRFLIVLPLFFYELKVSPNQERKILSVYVLSVAISCIISILLTLNQPETTNGFYEFSWHLSKYSVFSSNYLAIYSAFAAIIMFYSFFSTALFNKFSSAGLFIILLLYIALLGSRTAFFSMAIICCGYLVVKSIKNRRYIIYSALLLGGLLLLVLTVPYFKSRVMVLFTVGFEADARYYEYLGAKTILTKNFLLGVGYTGADEALVKEYERIGFHEGVENRFNAHNEFIQSALIFGVFGFALVSAMYGIMILKAFKKNKFLSLAFCVLFTLCSLTESLLERNKGIIFFAFFTGLLLLSKPSQDEAKE